MKDIISELISHVNETKKEIADAVAAGSANSFDVYQRLVGRNEGLSIALQILDDLMTGDEEQDKS
jgi:hypothetical protein